MGVDWAYVQNTPFKLYKHDTKQGGVQTSFIAHWPEGIDREPGSIVDKSAGSLYDIMPTCLELASARYPDVYDGHAIHPLDGQSLVPVLKGKEFQDRRDIFIEHEGNGMLRRGDYKVVRQFGEPWQLYDMADDRSENDNLASEGEHRERFVRMTGDFKKWADANHVIPGEQTKVYMQIHGYRSHRREQALLEAAENAPKEGVIQG